MAVQFDYIAKKGWKPNKENYLVTLLKIELDEKAVQEAKYIHSKKISEKKLLKELFEEAAATVAAESSTGTWTKVYDGKDSGIPLAHKLRALVYDLDYKKNMFKVAYPVQLSEFDNIFVLLAGIVGNIAGMKMVSAMRVYDVYFPKKIVRTFPGPRFGINGVRKLLNKPRGCLVATVPKPKIGRTEREQAKLTEILFNSGKGTYEGIKDDENLTN